MEDAEKSAYTGKNDEVQSLSVTKLQLDPEKKEDMKIEEIIGSMSSAGLSVEHKKEVSVADLIEEEEKLAMDFEYVPLKLVYNQLTTER